VPSYYCIVNLPGAPFREIAAVRGDNDDAACVALVNLAAAWPGFETIALYEGERAVSVLSNPALGFTQEPLGLLNKAA